MQRSATVLGILVLASVSSPLRGQVVVVEEGDVWHFLRGVAPPPLGWNELGFDPVAAGWESGVTGIGYGDDDDATLLEDMQQIEDDPATPEDETQLGYASVYLHVEIETTQALADFIWTLKVRYDDGFVAYVDGQEVARRGLLGNPPAFDELTEVDHEITSPFSFDEEILIPNGPQLLAPGTHVLAAEVHNATLTSSDLSFSVELAAVPFVVTGIDPSYGPVEGGNTVALNGLGFTPVDPPAVTFGGVSSEEVVVVDSQRVTALVPPGATGGLVDVEVSDSRGRVVVEDGYHYVSPGQVGLYFDDDEETGEDEFATAMSPGELFDAGTFEVWFRRDAEGFFPRFRAIVAIEAPGGGDAFRLELREGEARASLLGDDQPSLTAQAPIGNDVWHHLAFTYSPAGRRLYVDGDLVGSDTFAMELPTDTRIRIGDAFSGGGFFGVANFLGYVESVRVWNVARSAADIRRFRYALLDSEPGLESAWPLVEGGGATSENIGPARSVLVLGDSTDQEPADPTWAVLDDFPTVAIAAVEPNTSPVEGGGTARVYGKGFSADPPAEVFFGPTASPVVTFISSSELEAEVPPGDGFGFVDISVRTSGATVVVPNGFSYEPDEIFALVSEGDTWQYFVGSFAPPFDWATPDFDPALAGWLSGPTGIGYGDDDDATDVTQMLNVAATLYARVDFELEGDLSGLDLLRLRLRYDDGYVAYLNGTEIARVNVLGQPPLFDEVASDLHEITGGPGEFDEVIDITSRLGLLRSGQNTLAIEVHNFSLDSSDLSLSADLLYAGRLAPVSVLFMRGDVDRSGIVNVTDTIKILAVAFLGDQIGCPEAGDVNDDGFVDITDPIYALNFVFRGGPQPPPPYPELGPDQDEDRLPCEE